MNPRLTPLLLQDWSELEDEDVALASGFLCVSIVGHARLKVDGRGEPRLEVEIRGAICPS